MAGDSPVLNKVYRKAKGESVNMDKIFVRRYSAAFKQSVVREYEEGASMTELMKRYGIGSSRTLHRWIKQNGIEGIRHEVVVMQRADEQRREKELEARVKELEGAVAQLTLDKLMLESIVEVAKEQYGIDFKKNSGHRRLNKREKKP